MSLIVTVRRTAVAVAALAWSVVTTVELSNDAAIAALSPTDVWVAQLGGRRRHDRVVVPATFYAHDRPDPPG
jgi:hypothetical protein